MSDDKDEKSPIERALDLFLYAPIGFLLGADEVIPQLIERGRQQVQSARFFGQFAVQQGGAEAGKALAKVQGQAAEAVDQLGRRAGRTRPAAEPPAATGRAEPVPPATTAKEATAGSDGAGDTSALAIPDYDSLSASQVVPRLAGLSHDELEAVRTYEADHRGRKTILNRVAQLQAS